MASGDSRPFGGERGNVSYRAPGTVRPPDRDPSRWSKLRYMLKAKPRHQLGRGPLVSRNAPMSTAALEPKPPAGGLPVFLANGKRRYRAVQLAKVALGLALAGWLAALCASLIGFAPLPLPALFGSDDGHAASASRLQSPGRPSVADGTRRGASDRASGGKSPTPGRSARSTAGTSDARARTQAPTADVMRNGSSSNPAGSPQPSGTSPEPSAQSPPAVPAPTSTTPVPSGSTSSPDQPASTSSPDGGSGTTSTTPVPSDSTSSPDQPDSTSSPDGGSGTTSEPASQSTTTTPGTDSGTLPG
jgi:hypothetical protein